MLHPYRTTTVVSAVSVLPGMRLRASVCIAAGWLTSYPAKLPGIRAGHQFGRQLYIEGFLDQLARLPFPRRVQRVARQVYEARLRRALQPAYRNKPLARLERCQQTPGEAGAQPPWPALHYLRPHQTNVIAKRYFSPSAVIGPTGEGVGKDLTRIGVALEHK